VEGIYENRLSQIAGTQPPWSFTKSFGGFPISCIGYSNGAIDLGLKKQAYSCSNTDIKACSDNHDKKGGTMVIPISKGRAITISIFVMIFFGGALLHVHEASAEMKKVSGTSEIPKRILTSQFLLNETNVRLVNNLQLYSSADPDWDKARVFSMYFYINPTRDGDDYRGCLVITHQNGDQTFVEYDGSWKWTTPREGAKWIAESKGRFTGGTGKFEGIKGTITVKSEGLGSSTTSSGWEIEYEIK
jgi:hypothetical protein